MAARRTVDLAYPPHCAICETGPDDSGGDILLCVECRSKLVPRARLACRCCGAEVVSAAAEMGGCFCCRDRGFRFSTVVALGAYRDELRDTVLQMKSSRAEPLAMTMGRLLAVERAVQLHEIRAEVVVPVPMHWTRRWRRGTNSPELLARELARSLHVPLSLRALVRTRRTRPQNELLPEERPANIRGAFRVGTVRRIRGRRVLLIDDVLTTGATAQEATSVLLAGGAADVAVAVLARAESTARK